VTAPAFRFIVLLGAVSLFADATYEGARSITGPFLAMLGATGTVVGIVAGLGELVGYGLRLVSGFISDRTGRYWAITLVGYAVNLAAVPLLALAGRWEIAALLIVAERLGKAIRTPARDAMLSHAAKSVGRGWGFGLHEALDQVGAVLGPLVVAGVLARGAGFGVAFGMLIVPATLAFVILLGARRIYPRPRDLEVATPDLSTAGFHRGFWIYLAAVALIAAGYADFPLIAYHFGKRAIVPAASIPVFYAVAMGVDALGALLFGRLFDRFGLSILVAATLLSVLFAPLAFLGGTWMALTGMVLWGLGMGAQESIMRAAVADLVPAGRRGSAYGIFNAGFGVSWFLGSAAMGVLYDTSVRVLVAFSVAVQLAAIPFLVIARRILSSR
jgi:MFS family permease